MHASLSRALRTAVSLLAVAWLLPAAAETRCGPSGEPGVERCVSGVPAPMLAAMQQTQLAGNWCWAASISMVLRSHGLRIRQDEVVRTEFGASADVGLDGQGMTRLLTRQWTDSRGQARDVSALPLPSWRRGQGLLAPEVLEELDQGRPLILGAGQHAVVLVQLVYDRPVDPDAAQRTAVRPARAVVLDPAAAIGIRSARAPEWHPEYLARVHARPVPGSADTQPVRLAAQADLGSELP